MRAFLSLVVNLRDTDCFCETHVRCVRERAVCVTVYSKYDTKSMGFSLA